MPILSRVLSHFSWVREDLAVLFPKRAPVIIPPFTPPKPVAPTPQPHISAAPAPAPEVIPQAPKESPMSSTNTVQAYLADGLAFIEKAAPNVGADLVADAKQALATAESAFTPVADAAVVAAVGLITSKFALNAPFSATEIAFIEGIIAKLQGLLPTV